MYYCQSESSLLKLLKFLRHFSHFLDPIDPISSPAIRDCIAAETLCNMALDPALRGFENLDDVPVYEKFEKAIIDPATRNFVIEFDESKAYAALDIDKSILETFLPIKVSIDSSAQTPIE